MCRREVYPPQSPQSGVWWGVIRESGWGEGIGEGEGSHEVALLGLMGKDKDNLMAVKWTWVIFGQLRERCVKRYVYLTHSQLFFGGGQNILQSTRCKVNYFLYIETLWVWLGKMVDNVLLQLFVVYWDIPAMASQQFFVVYEAVPATASQ